MHFKLPFVFISRAKITSSILFLLFRHLEKDMSTGLNWNWKTRHYERQEFKKKMKEPKITPRSNEERVTKRDSKYKRYRYVSANKKIEKLSWNLLKINKRS